MADKTDPKWSERNKKLHRTFVFPGFAEAMAFMVQVALYCEKQDHHPEWTNVYNRVQVALSTHDAGAVTGKDRALAKKMDAVYAHLASPAKAK